MEAYKYILDCNKCNYHLLFNECDTQIEKEKIGYACEIHTKRKSALNKIYYRTFSNLESLIEIIKENNSDILYDVLDRFKVYKYIVCPNCGEKIILNCKILYIKDYLMVDAYNYDTIFKKITDNEFLKTIL